MCRPARMSRGRSSRSSIQRGVAAEPASRSSSAPASRSVSACCSLHVVGHRAVLVETDVAVRVDQSGDDPASVDALGGGDLVVGHPAIDDVQVTPLVAREDDTGHLQRGSHAETLLDGRRPRHRTATTSTAEPSPSSRRTVTFFPPNRHLLPAEPSPSSRRTVTFFPPNRHLLPAEPSPSSRRTVTFFPPNRHLLPAEPSPSSRRTVTFFPPNVSSFWYDVRPIWRNTAPGRGPSRSSQQDVRARERHCVRVRRTSYRKNLTARPEQPDGSTGTT